MTIAEVTARGLVAPRVVGARWVAADRGTAAAHAAAAAVEPVAELPRWAADVLGAVR